jgi:hypothetical protein
MAETQTCAVCGKPIEPNQSRYVDVHAGTPGVKRHVHIECRKT